MSLSERIRFIPRRLIADDRGWFIKVIEGNEVGLPRYTGEIYLVMAQPGQTRGGHYHRKAKEWFTVIQGTACVFLLDIETGESAVYTLSLLDSVTIYVPPNVFHSFRNFPISPEPMIIAAYTDRLFDPCDTIRSKSPDLWTTAT